MPDRPVRVLFVCLGNICRSPLSEAVFRDRVAERGLADAFEIDSAGTADYHVGEPPDRRMVATGARHDHDLSALRGRQVTAEDLKGPGAWDHVFVMDKSNLHDVLSLDPNGDHGTRVRLFREFDPQPDDFQVPDPWYGDGAGFERVYEIVDRTAEAILNRLVAAHDLG